MVGAWFLSHQVLLKLRIWGQARRGGNARTRGICFRSCLPVQPYWMRTAGNRFPAFLSGNSTQGVPVSWRTVVFCPARSVGRATPDAVHLSEEVDSRRVFDTRARHFGFEFVGSYECARLFQTLPFEEKSKVVDVSSAAENTATELAVFVPPVKGGIERRFPGHIVGDFVVDENGNHDFGGTPFTVKRCSKRRRNARAGIPED